MWLDTRIHKPTSNAFYYYQVVFFYCDRLFVGYCGYAPINGWDKPKSFTGNKIDGQVIAYRENPPIPKFIRIRKEK